MISSSMVHYTTYVQGPHTKVTWLVTFVKIGFAQISHVPESSLPRIKNTPADFNCCCCYYGTAIQSCHKGDKISIHSLIAGAFSTMPHNLSPHFTWFVMLQGWSCSPIAMIRQQQSQFKKSSHRGLHHVSRAVVSSSTRMAKPTMQARWKERSLTHSERLTILVETHLK